jgi:ABC-type glutathione transport system ATPase component
MSEPLLSVRGLQKSFRTTAGGRGRVVAVHGVSFDIQPSECVALVGESGSGKSTTARCILQLERPDTGEVVYEGNDLCRLRGSALRSRRGGMQAVFQDPLGSLDPRLSIAASVAEGLDIKRLDRTERDHRVFEALGLVGLSGYADRRPHQVSGGQAQRAAIARAIVSRPRLIVLDEAVSSLDVSIQAQILNLLRDLQQELAVAYLFISHNLAVVTYLSDRVIIMHGGEIVEEGTTARVVGAPQSAHGARLVEAAARLESAAHPWGGVA